MLRGSKVRVQLQAVARSFLVRRSQKAFRSAASRIQVPATAPTRFVGMGVPSNVPSKSYNKTHGATAYGMA
jgi:hypothetical protein